MTTIVPALSTHLYRNENSTGDTPLLAAASKGHVDVCRCLLSLENKNDAKEEDDLAYLLYRTNRNGDTALMVAVANAQTEDDCLQLVDKLLRCDQRLTNNDNNKNNNNSTPLLLLHTANHKGLTPLLIACERNLPRVITTLLQTWNASLLVVEGNPDSFSSSSSNNHNPLAIAAFCGNLEAATALLDHYDDHHQRALLLDHPNERGCTPLWLACRTGHAKMASLLLRAGADATLADQDGVTPLRVAETYGKTQVTELLRNARG